MTLLFLSYLMILSYHIMSHVSSCFTLSSQKRFMFHLVLHSGFLLLHFLAGYYWLSDCIELLTSYVWVFIIALVHCCIIGICGVFLLRDLFLSHCRLPHDVVLLLSSCLSTLPSSCRMIFYCISLPQSFTAFLAHCLTLSTLSFVLSCFSFIISCDQPKLA